MKSKASLNIIDPSAAYKIVKISGGSVEGVIKRVFMNSKGLNCMKIKVSDGHYRYVTLQDVAQIEKVA